jgi:hypothetical protein
MRATGCNVQQRVIIGSVTIRESTLCAYNLQHVSTLYGNHQIKYSHSLSILSAIFPYMYTGKCFHLEEAMHVICLMSTYKTIQEQSWE